MKRHEYWRKCYRENRYMASAAIEDLEQRSRDLLANGSGPNEEGKIGPRFEDTEHARYWELWTHLLEELDLRGLNWQRPGLIDRSLDAMPWRKYVGPLRGFRVLRGGKLPEKPYFARVFPKRDWAIGAFERGEIYINPASRFSDPSLNRAVQDDELTIASVKDGRKVTVRKLDPQTGQYGDVIPTIGEFRTSVAHADFHALCVTYPYDYRIFDDFHGEALLVITDLPEFLDRLRKAARPHIPGMIECIVSDIQYVDPYFIEARNCWVPFTKHFRYAYQKEFRVIWTNQDTKLEPFMAKLGPLTDISTLYLWEDASANLAT